MRLRFASVLLRMSFGHDGLHTRLLLAWCVVISCKSEVHNPFIVCRRNLVKIAERQKTIRQLEGILICLLMASTDDPKSSSQTGFDSMCNVNPDLINHWVLYFLRGTIVLADYQSPFAGVPHNMPMKVGEMADIMIYQSGRLDSYHLLCKDNAMRLS